MLAWSAGPSSLALTEASLAIQPAHRQRRSALQAAALPLQRAPSALKQQRLLCAGAVCALAQGLGEQRVAAWRAVAVPAALRWPAGQGQGQGQGVDLMGVSV